MKPTQTIEEFLQKLDQDTASEEEDNVSLDNEKLPGSCKSQYAMKFKLETDRSIENLIMAKKRVFDKSVTKGRFQPAFQTNAG